MELGIFAVIQQPITQATPTYQCVSLGLGLLAILIAFLSYRRSGKAVRIAEDANEIFSKQLQELAALNTPNLVFSTRVEPHGLAYSIVVVVFNAGGHATEIVEGDVTLTSRQHPEANKSYILSGQKIGGRSEHLIKLEAKASFIHGDGSGIAPAEIICNATYTRTNQKDERTEFTYVYDGISRNFIPKK